MKPLTAEWVAKAERDFATMEREAQVAEDPNFEGICVHAQHRCRTFRAAARQALGLDK